jgi:hypothetical protein
MRRTKDLCDNNCNECEAIQNKQVALLLNVLALRFGGEVWGITNRICPNLTCCPICHIDDFCHDSPDAKSGIICIDALGLENETCEVATEALKVFEAIKKEKGVAEGRTNEKISS